MDADYANDIGLLANASIQAEVLLYRLEQAVAGIGLHVNTDKMEYMCFNQRRQVHLPRKQYLINWNRHQHVTSKGTDSYWWAIGYMEVRPDWWNEMQFLPSRGRINTAVWMHYVDAH